MENPNDAIPVYIEKVIKATDNAVKVDTGHGAAWMPLNATLIWDYQDQLVMFVPQWAMEQKRVLQNCKRMDVKWPYFFMENNAKLLDYWIIPAVLKWR